MQLKEYQQATLDAFERYLKELEIQERRCNRQADAGETDADVLDFPRRTWRALEMRGELPSLKKPDGTLEAPQYVSRFDDRRRPVPHICFKVPTGGGKTLLAATALERLHPLSGIVLWVTPSKAIFRQTWTALATRLHPYRQALERASGGRVKLFRKGDPISRFDVENHLCLLPVMLQAAGGRETRDFLKVFRDSGKYKGFFPSTDDALENKKMRSEYPDLHASGLGDCEPANTIKRSLFNVLKIMRPIVILDEAHTAYSDARRKRLCEFNPRIVIELSATPKVDASNILVDISGEELKRENMIKLPVNIHSIENTDWKYTLSKSVGKLDELQRHANELAHETGRYIRPIMLIRVERVGKDQRDGEHIHAEDVQEELIQLGVNEDNIRFKTSARDEIADENLLSPYSPVRFIITKDALREGWDCSFAYVLTLLDTTKTDLSITQMTGRVLRQPDTEPTGTQALDECYIYCFDTTVSAAAARVKAGLEQEGLGDLGQYVQGDERTTSVQRTFARNPSWLGTRIFLPQVLHCATAGRRKYRPMDYERDVLASLDWEQLAETGLDMEALIKLESRETILRIDPFQKSVLEAHRNELEVEPEIGIGYFVRRIADAVPMPWLAANLVASTLRRLKREGMTDHALYASRADLAERMREQFSIRAEHEAHNIFCKKIKDGSIRFDLVAGNNFELPMSVNKVVEVTQKRLQGDGGTPLQRPLFDQDGIFEKEFNALERNFALHVDGYQAVMWWHRLAAKIDGYALQGWKRGRMYPDFIVCISSSQGPGPRRQMLVLETKGLHLSGNPDTEYKKLMLERLEELAPHAEECGNIELRGKKQKYRMKLRILMENTWPQDFQRIVQGVS